MTHFLQENLSTVIVAAAVFGALAAVAARLIINRRKGKTTCGCGHCAAGCDSRTQPE
ncbi:FeoB-associated Cys-rich membrane protein [Treponema endosymbiont of Eucomonympha sp.]|uniref:FeoB-associated Cys-rich membrane protein n=1 Tax=Treponema endosymbiont of Eucomonympha sp. TaxID=1580831 RepID=UPI000AD6BC49|nr:FeoB-associated Cys-rich membrane protein [Treponema endosymbiont of Eucomonympha sp.]